MQNYLIIAFKIGSNFFCAFFDCNVGRNFCCYFQGLSLFPSNLTLNLQSGKLMLSHGEKEAAVINLWNCCKREETSADEIDEDSVDLKKEAISLLRTNFIDQWFFRMLNDKRRNLNYKLAIKQV